MLSNAYFLAKFRFDTAENERAKKNAKFCKKLQNKLPILQFLPPADRVDALAGDGVADGEARQVLRDEPRRPADVGGLGRLAEPRAQGSGSVDGETLRLACSFFVTLPRIPGKPGRNAIQ